MLQSRADQDSPGPASQFNVPFCPIHPLLHTLTPNKYPTPQTSSQCLFPENTICNTHTHTLLFLHLWKYKFIQGLEGGGWFTVIVAPERLSGMGSQNLLSYGSHWWRLGRFSLAEAAGVHRSSEAFAGSSVEKSAGVLLLPFSSMEWTQGPRGVPELKAAVTHILLDCFHKNLNSPRVDQQHMSTLFSWW